MTILQRILALPRLAQIALCAALAGVLGFQLAPAQAPTTVRLTWGPAARAEKYVLEWSHDQAVAGLDTVAGNSATVTCAPGENVYRVVGVNRLLVSGRPFGPYRAGEWSPPSELIYDPGQPGTPGRPAFTIMP